MSECFLSDLFREHGDRLRRELARRSGDAAMADDLLQELFVRAIGHADDLQDRPDHDRLAWLFKAARRLGVDHLRRRAAAARAYGRHAARVAARGEPPGPLQAAVAADLRRRLFDAIRRLPPPQRRAVRLHLRGLQDRALPPGTARWHLHAARRRLMPPLADDPRNEARP